MRPRVPSMSCRSVTRSRSFSIEFAIEQTLAFDDDEHIEFARRKSPRHFLVLLEFWRVGTKQLAQQIVDLEPGDAETRGDCKEDRDKGDGKGKIQGDEADTLDAESKLVQPFFGGFSRRRLGLAGICAIPKLSSGQ